MECENNFNTYDEDVEVLFSVGRRFLTGNGLEKDVAKGKEMLTQAAMMGHSLAQQLLERYNAENAKAVEEPKQESDPLTEPTHEARAEQARYAMPCKKEEDSESCQMLEYNKRFVAEKMYEQYATSKYPDRKIAIVTCMDTRLVQLLPAALGIKNGDVKIIKNAGGTITNPFDSTVRSLLVAIYELGVNEVMIIGHTGCGVQGMDGAEMLHLMRERGIDEEHI